MNQRRILIGAMVGVFIFTLMSIFFDAKTAFSLENQVIQGRSLFKVFKNPPNFLVIEFDENSKYELFARSSEDQKQAIINLISEISLTHPEKTYLLIKNDNPLMLDSSDLQDSLDQDLGAVEITKLEEVETNIHDSKGRDLILDQEAYPFELISSDDVNSANFQKRNLQDTKVLIISPEIASDKNKISLLINFLEAKWLNFIKIPSLILLVCDILFGILFAALLYWARLAVLFASTVIMLALGQLTFSLLNTHIETIPFLASILGIFIITNIFDLNLGSIYRKEFLKSQAEENESKTKKLYEKSIPEIINEQSKKKEEKIANPELVKELRTKFFYELESNLEDIALSFEERTVRSINNIQDKFTELLSSSELGERDKTKIDIIKHNFNNMIEEIDAILFNLVPFRFENKSGLLSLLEVYAGKVFVLSKGKVQIITETDIPSLRLEIGQKINTYRIIQKLIELIKENNQERAVTGLRISIDIVSNIDDMINFKITYEGKAINTTANSYKLKEIYRRLDGIDSGSLDLGDTLAGVSSNLTNHIILKIKSPSFSLL